MQESIDLLHLLVGIHRSIISYFRPILLRFLLCGVALDYSGYCIEHFPYFETEHPRLAEGFADTIDATYDDCSWMDDEPFRDAIADALDVFFHPNSALL